MSPEKITETLEQSPVRRWWKKENLAPRLSLGDRPLLIGQIVFQNGPAVGTQALQIGQAAHHVVVHRLAIGQYLSGSLLDLRCLDTGLLVQNTYGAQ